MNFDKDELSNSIENGFLKLQKVLSKESLIFITLLNYFIFYSNHLNSLIFDLILFNERINSIYQVPLNQII